MKDSFAVRYMDLLQLRWMLVSTDILRQNMILFLVGERQTSAIRVTPQCNVSMRLHIFIL